MRRIYPSLICCIFLVTVTLASYTESNPQTKNLESNIDFSGVEKFLELTAILEKALVKDINNTPAFFRRYSRADMGSPFRKSITLTFSAGIQTGLRFGTLVPTPQTADVPPIDILLEPAGPAWGLSLGYQFSPHFELQGYFLFGRKRIINDVGIGFAGIPLGKSKASDASSYSYVGRVLYYFCDSRISPYLSAGAGAMTFRTAEFGSKTRLLLNFGAGMRAKLSHSTQAFLDLRDNVTHFKFVQDFRYFIPMIYNTTDFKSVQHGFSIAAGLSYIF